MVSEHEDGQPLRMPLPLSSHDAFWHACTGTQYEPSARGDFECSGPIDDSRIGDILFGPRWYAPKNPYYVKNHVSAPGTVRQWFRTMRAADFARDVEFASKQIGGVFFWIPSGLRHWTLFDTQAVVDRETAAHYLGLDAGCTLFGLPVAFRDDIKRSAYPIVSSTVPTGRGALTLDDIRRFMDDVRRELRGEP